MKYTTANVKNSDYNEDHVVYIGTQTGSFKSKSYLFSATMFHMARFIIISGIDIFNRDNPHKQSNLQSLSSVKKESKITSICFADDENNEILVGRGDSVIRTFDCSKNDFCSLDLSIPEGKVVGLAWSLE